MIKLNGLKAVRADIEVLALAAMVLYILDRLCLTYVTFVAKKDM
jgi:hypothetical protein